MELRNLIDQHCKSCTYDKLIPGTWRAQVGRCTVTKCQLWPARPVSKNQIRESTNEDSNQ